MPLLVPTTRPVSQDFGPGIAVEADGWYAKDGSGLLLKGVTVNQVTNPHFAGSIFDHNLHTAIDLFGPVGTPLYACEDGVVDLASLYQAGTIRVKIRPGTYYALGHCDSFLVKVGQEVKKGQMIARMGNRATGGGHTTGPHTHFEVQHTSDGVTRMRYNPAPFYPAKTFRFAVYGGAYLPSHGSLVNSDWVFPIRNLSVNSPDVNLRESPDTNSPIVTKGTMGMSMSQLNWVEGGQYDVGGVTGTTWAKVKYPLTSTTSRVVYIAKPLVHNV